MGYDLEQSATLGIVGGLVSAEKVVQRSWSSYTWLDKLNSMKDFPQEPQVQRAELVYSPPSSNIKSRSAEPVMCSIIASRFRVEDRVPCSHVCLSDGPPACSCEKYDSRSGPADVKSIDDSENVFSSGTDTLEPRAVLGYVALDVFGMEDNRRRPLILRGKVSRKATKRCFLSKSSDQLAKEAKHRMSRGFLIQAAEAETKEWARVLQGESVKDANPPRSAAGGDIGILGAKSIWVWKESALASPVVSTGKLLMKNLSLEPSSAITLSSGSTLQQVRKDKVTSTWVALDDSGTGRPVLNKCTSARNREIDSALPVSQVAVEARLLSKFEEARISLEESKQQRSCTKRKRCLSQSEPGMDNQPAREIPVLELASDHPSKKPVDSLGYVTYQVFLQAGRRGLTAREAASQIVNSGSGGFFQGLVKPRIKIGKLLRNNPYYFQAGEGRYILCEAIVGVTQAVSCLQAPGEQFHSLAFERKERDISPSTLTDVRKEAAAMARRRGTAKYWAQMHANGWTRGSKGRHENVGTRRHKIAGGYEEAYGGLATKSNEVHEFLGNQQGQHEVEGLVQAHFKPQLKGLLKNAVDQKPCKRSDGKNWQCPLLAPSDSNYCEHHQKGMKQAAEIQRARVPAPVTAIGTKETVVEVVQPHMGKQELGKWEGEELPVHSGNNQCLDSACIQSPRVTGQLFQESQSWQVVESNSYLSIEEQAL